MSNKAIHKNVDNIVRRIFVINMIMYYTIIIVVIHVRKKIYVGQIYREHV